MPQFLTLPQCDAEGQPRHTDDLTANTICVNVDHITMIVPVPKRPQITYVNLAGTQGFWTLVEYGRLERYLKNGKPL